MAIAFKPTCGLNVFALQYVNSQCQHDSLILKLAAKLRLFTETAKFPTNYFIRCLSYILCIYFFKIICGAGPIRTATMTSARLFPHTEQPSLRLTRQRRFQDRRRSV